jgi:hypothetical protein
MTYPTTVDTTLLTSDTTLFSADGSFLTTYAAPAVLGASAQAQDALALDSQLPSASLVATADAQANAAMNAALAAALTATGSAQLFGVVGATLAGALLAGQAGVGTPVAGTLSVSLAPSIVTSSSVISAPASVTVALSAQLQARADADLAGSLSALGSAALGAQAAAFAGAAFEATLAPAVISAQLFDAYTTAAVSAQLNSTLLASGSNAGAFLDVSTLDTTQFAALAPAQTFVSLSP